MVGIQNQHLPPFFLNQVPKEAQSLEWWHQKRMFVWHFHLNISMFIQIKTISFKFNGFQDVYGHFIHDKTMWYLNSLVRYCHLVILFLCKKHMDTPMFRFERGNLSFLGATHITLITCICVFQIWQVWQAFKYWFISILCWDFGYTFNMCRFFMGLCELSWILNYVECGIYYVKYM